jgi:hypothetical protein
MEHNSTKNRGDVAIYTSLLVMTIMLAGAVVMGGLLARQIRLGRSVITTERAFYGAYSGLEQALYEVVVNNKSDPITGTVDYTNPDGTAADPVEYKSSASKLTNGQLCAFSSGQLGSDQRRVTLRGPGCPSE